MEKVIRDGQVAVLYSPGLGAGWSTWADDGIRNQLIFHPELVRLVENNEQEKITTEFVEELLGIEGVYDGGARNLEIEWVTEGEAFEIQEYEGSESVHVVSENQNIIIA